MYRQVNPIGNPQQLRCRWFRLALCVLCLVSALAASTTTSRASNSPSFTGINRLSEGFIQLGIYGATDSVYLLQFSSDLAGWTPLVTLANTTGTLQFTDAPLVGTNQRFYRLQNAVASASAYWTNAQQTHNFVVGNLLTPYNSYRITPGATIAYEWYCVSQIYADEVMTLYGDSGYAPHMNNSYNWMNNFWDGGNPVGGYFSTANTDGTGQGGGKYVDDNSLAGNVYLDCYAV